MCCLRRSFHPFTPVVGNGRDETIAFAGQRFDEVRLFCRISQRFP